MEFLLWILFFIKMIIFSYMSWEQILSFFICSIIFIHGYINYIEYSQSNNIFMNAVSYILNYVIMFYFIFNNFLDWFKFTYVGNKIYRLLTYLENCYQSTKRNIIMHGMRRMLTLGTNNLRNMPRYSNDSDETDDN